MGSVNFLHGLIPPIKVKKKPSIICPNEKCHRKIETVKTLKGKKVCPFCQRPIPASMLKKLDEKDK